MSQPVKIRCVEGLPSQLLLLHAQRLSTPEVLVGELETSMHFHCGHNRPLLSLAVLFGLHALGLHPLHLQQYLPNPSRRSHKLKRFG